MIQIILSGLLFLVERSHALGALHEVARDELRDALYSADIVVGLADEEGWCLNGCPTSSYALGRIDLHRSELADADQELLDVEALSFELCKAFWMSGGASSRIAMHHEILSGAVEAQGLDRRGWDFDQLGDDGFEDGGRWDMLHLSGGC